MDHHYYKERISAYADNALLPYEQMAVEEHLATCPECRVELEKIRKLGEFIEQKGNLGEDEYWEKQALKIEERLGIAQTEVTPVSGRRTWRGLGWKLTAAAASISLVGILAFYTKDSIWQKTDQPVVSPPAIQKSTEPARDTQSEQPLQKQVMPATQVEGETRSGAAQDKKTVTAVITDSIRRETAKKDAIAPAEDIVQTELQSNYKDAPVMMVPSAPTVESLPKEESLAQPVEQVKVIAVPAERVDKLLESVAGVKTKSNSGVVIRGGRVGEVEYTVDSTPAEDTTARVNKAGKAMVVKGARDVISKFDMNNLVSRSAEQLKSSLVQSGDSLSYWRSVRATLGEISSRREYKPVPAILNAKPDSLRGQPEKMGVAKLDSLRGKAAGLITNDSVTLNGLAGTIEFKIHPKSDSYLLRVYYNIARLSKDSTEIAEARRVLFMTAWDSKSPYHSLAQAYLDSLGVK